MAITLSMNCPSCGGTLSIEEGSRLTSCPYCTSVLGIEGDRGVGKIMLKGVIGQDEVMNAANNWMKGSYTAPDLNRVGKIKECFAIYLPFWKIRGRAAGWVCGNSIEEDSHGDNVTVYKEKMVIKDFDWNGIACDSGDLGIKHLKDIDGEAMLHDEGSIPAFEVTTSASDALNFGMGSIRRTAIKWAGVDNVTFVNMHVFPKDVKIVFYPVWVVRYSYYDSIYLVTIDGITGKVLSGRAPGDVTIRSASMAIGTAAGAFGTVLGIWMASVDSSMIGIPIIVIIVSLLIAAGGFVYGRRDTEFTVGEVKGGSPLRSLMEKRSHGVSDSKVEQKVRIK
ncbi:hypothetical protein CUJ83_13540 [Methanocella sp. CWC-04]|uniref:Zinc ribbon domain-containing protein n=1 Tax=Methanooceanicella nereidis TaxID=2052831 RepID=A0AAP2W8G6_9EURY|nr:hypothetical protein [Methanocella sp. CWC-04]MCD1296021.1 hypothetical protein [Methanocella sp. CWC-04]